ncbi:phage tail protein [Bradyrhizobium yuanmingense]|uniref:tail fiber protein n=1 Tax=Bradyrhizobium yuanmingense TaxID=108015 RepID=UPI000FE2A3CE|nr:tail fiber protein [Bradyrhizobium yuanmingense]TGN75975.1 phage tail protein [Bradyrhizobium yuanmingense]
MTFYKWSQTSATNATADSTINYQEGQAPSSLNDSARAAMAALAKYRDDVTGAITTSGTSTAYTVASYQVFNSLANMGGKVIAFTPHTTNGATVTLNVDGLGAKPLRSAPSVELPAGVLVQGTPYVALYNNSDQAFYLQSFFSNPYSIPIGASIDFWGTTAPNSSFVLAYGQAISRSTYSTLFAMFSTTYGSGDGSSTFNIPDLRGRVIAGKDDMGGSIAGRLTSTYFGTGATTLGGVGQSNESNTLVTANLPPYTPSGSVSIAASSVPFRFANIPVGGGSNVTVIDQISFTGNSGSTSLGAPSGSFSGSAQGGTSTPIRTVQPTIIANKLLRVI